MVTPSGFSLEPQLMKMYDGAPDSLTEDKSSGVYTPPESRPHEPNTSGYFNVLKKVAEKIGHDPEYVISDNGSTMGKAVRDAGYRHHLDISHSLGMFLERIYKNEPDFQELSKKVSDARFKYNMQEVAFIQPPSQRSIARFINMSKWIKWASRMQYVYHTLQDDIKSIYGFIPQNASLVDELSEVMGCINRIEKDIKNNGISHESAARCRQIIRNTLM